MDHKIKYTRSGRQTTVQTQSQAVGGSLTVTGNLAYSFVFSGYRFEQSYGAVVDGGLSQFILVFVLQPGCVQYALASLILLALLHNVPYDIILYHDSSFNYIDLLRCGTFCFHMHF